MEAGATNLGRDALVVSDPALTAELCGSSAMMLGMLSQFVREKTDSWSDS